MKVSVSFKALPVLSAALIIVISTNGCTQEGAEKSDKPGSSSPAAQKGAGPALKYNANGDIVTTANNLSNFAGLAERIKTEKIPDTTIIVTVDDDAINVNDYKKEFRYRAAKAKINLAGDPRARNAFLQRAKKIGLKLSEREKANFLEKAREKGGEKLRKLLAEDPDNQKRFEQDVLDTGLALKMTYQGIEERLLPLMINDSLLISAARKAGLGKQAYNKYIEFKHSPQYQIALNASELTAHQFKDRVVEDLMVQHMQERILKKAEVSDKRIYEFYKQQVEKKNSKLKHNGRYQWSQIAIAAPTRDFGATPSLATTIRRKYSDLKPEEREKKLKELRAEKEKIARSVLTRVRSGENFAKLANTYTDDIDARAARSGGSMGYMALEDLKKNALFKEVGTALESMKPGDVYPELIRTEFGWHIVKLDGKQKKGIIPFEEVKDRLKHYYVSQSGRAAIQQWLIDKRKVAPVIVNKKFKEIVAGLGKGESNQSSTVDEKKQQAEKSVNEDKKKQDARPEAK